MQLRPYQQECVGQVFESWKTFDKSLIVIPTGGGKTIIFAHIADRCHGKTLIIAHREELLAQAIEKIGAAVGITAHLERAETWAPLGASVVVGSIQTLSRRADRFGGDHFDTVIVDEAHHVAADSYQSVLSKWPKAKVLGVTATPDRADKKQLGTFFDTVAYEVTLLDLIKQGYLSPIKVRVCDVSIDLTKVRLSAGDYDSNESAMAIEPYLRKVAEQIKEFGGKKTLVFLPLISTSETMTSICRSIGLNATHVDGNSPDRKEILKKFKDDERAVLCNAMLLTEGYDEPSIDTIVCLRPTRSRALYTQMVGRGTRLSNGKTHLTILDFLWMTGKHDLVKPTRLVAHDEVGDIAERMISTQGEFDLEDVLKDATHEREQSLLRELTKKKRNVGKLVDPVEFCLSIHDTSGADYVPTMPWHHQPISEGQRKVIEGAGIDVSAITCKGHASVVIDKIMTRRSLKLASPKQVRFLQKCGVMNPHLWKFDNASKFIDSKMRRGY